MKFQVGIIWANPYNRNLGVAALAYSALALLYDVVEEHGLPAEFSFFGSERDGWDEITVNDKLIRFKNIRGMDFYHWKSRIKMLLFPRKHQVAEINSITFAFDIAEGDSFTDIYGDVRFRKICNSKYYFGRRVKKQVLLPQTIGPFNRSENEKAAFKAMGYADMVISRDSQSFRYTAGKLPADRIAESIDVAFYLPYSRTDFEGGKTHVGVNISGLLWNGGYTRNNQFGMKTDYKKLMLGILQYFNEQEDIQLHLVSHVIPEHQPVEDDYEAARVLQEAFPRAILAPRFDTPIAAKSYISGLDFFTGARMHACIAAFSTGVPVFPLAYSRKFNGLFIETLQYQWLGDCVNTNEDTVLEGLKEAYYKRQGLKEKIQEGNDGIVKPRIAALKKLLYSILT